MKEETFVKPLRTNKALMFDIPSRTIENFAYKVRVMPSGEVRCSCKGHVLGGHKCVHMKDFLKVYNQDRFKLMKDITTEEVMQDYSNSPENKLDWDVDELEINIEI